MRVKSLGDYLLLMLRGLPRQMGVGLLLRVLVVAPISLGALLLHTWILVYFNEGTNPDGSLVSQSLALGGLRLLTGTVLYTFGAFLLSTLISEALLMGPVHLIRNWLKVPGWIGSSAREGGGLGVVMVG